MSEAVLTQPQEATALDPYILHVVEESVQPVVSEAVLGDQTPVFGQYDQATQMRQWEALKQGLAGIAPEEVLEQTEGYLSRAYTEYEHGSDRGPFEYAFLVPSRFSGSDASRAYVPELTDFIPAVRYMAQSDIVRFLSMVPPSVIDTYEGGKGCVIFTPLFSDIMSLGRDALPVGNKVVNDAVAFARDKFDVKVVGLGATLPKFTRFGQNIDVEGVTTTTGHGGTVWLIGETADQVIESKGIATNTLGVIGAGGSIGQSSAVLLQEKYPNADLLVYDVNEVALDRLKKALPSNAKVRLARDNREVLEGSSIIVSALTDTLDLTRDMSGIDLTDRYIIDDTQPPAFNRVEVEGLGAKVLWVVGQDHTLGNRLTRKNYLFGEGIGLLSTANVFGCEAEAYCVAQEDDRPAAAIRQRVNPQAVRSIGELMARHGITTAATQSFGKPVNL